MPFVDNGYGDQSHVFEDYDRQGYAEQMRLVRESYMRMQHREELERAAERAAKRAAKQAHKAA